MGPFNGWDKKDFEAFLSVEEDADKHLRLRIKDKLKRYLDELRAMLEKEKIFIGLSVDIGNIKQTSDHAWGVLSEVKNKVSKPHFNFWVNSDVFGMGVLMEGKSAAEPMKKYAAANPDKFLTILRELDDFNLFIRERLNQSGRPRGWQGFDRLVIKTGKDLKEEDVAYIIKKMFQYPLCEIHVLKTFKRDMKSLGDQAFLQKSVELMKELENLYNFSWGR